jgi:hypothetical protein
MPDFSRRETFGRFGTAPMYLNKELASTPFTANATVVHPIGPPARKAYFSGGTVSCTTVAVDADGTCLVEFAKYDASATAYVALTTGYNIEGLTTLIGSAFIPAIATLTAAQLTFDTGDVLVVRCISNSAAVDTQPTKVCVTAELFAKD